MAYMERLEVTPVRQGKSPNRALNCPLEKLAFLLGLSRVVFQAIYCLCSVHVSLDGCVCIFLVTLTLGPELGAYLFYIGTQSPELIVYSCIRVS